MITIEQINGEIAVLEEEKPTHVIMEKLANLYVVRDHMGIGEPDISAPVISEHIMYDSDTEFMSVLKSKDVNSVMPILDELMETIQLLNPRLYDSVMRNINEI